MAQTNAEIYGQPPSDLDRHDSAGLLRQIDMEWARHPRTQELVSWFEGNRAAAAAAVANKALLAEPGDATAAMLAWHFANTALERIESLRASDES